MHIAEIIEDDGLSDSLARHKVARILVRHGKNKKIVRVKTVSKEIDTNEQSSRHSKLAP